MTNEELKIKLAALPGTPSVEDGAELPVMTVEPTTWKAVAQQLRNDGSLQFDFLSFVTCIDWKTHVTMVYQLESTTWRHNLSVKITLPAADPEVETVSDVWPGANFHEREVYELFGVNFLNHPDLRLLILPDGWEGKNPLRKDFEDPVNMIKL